MKRSNTLCALSGTYVSEVRNDNETSSSDCSELPDMEIPPMTETENVSETF